MTFYERFEILCKSRGLRPQSDEIIEMTQVSSPAISGWKKGSLPKAEVIIRMASYFRVSTDYLLGLEDKGVVDRSNNVITNSINESPNSTLTINQGLSKQEAELVAMFREFGIEKQYQLLTFAFKLRDE